MTSKPPPDAGGDQAALVGEDHGLCPVAQTQLGEDAADVGLDGRPGQVEAAGEFGVAQPLREQAQYLEFPWVSEAGSRCSAAASVPGGPCRTAVSAPGVRSRTAVPAPPAVWRAYLSTRRRAMAGASSASPVRTMRTAVTRGPG